MTYPLSEDFSDALGRWNGFAPFDGTEASDGVKGFLATQEHVDLRSFRFISDTIAAPQNPDLDTVAQTVLDAQTQTSMETDPGASTAGENWTMYPASSTLTVTGTPITDAIRSAALGGDGDVPNSSYGIWDGATNLCAFGGFEGGTTGWTRIQGIETFAQSTATHKFGSACASIQVLALNGTGQGIMTSSMLPVVGGSTNTLSMWMKGAAGGEQVQMFWHEYQADGVTSNGFKNGPTVTLTTTWTRYTFTSATVATTTQVVIAVNNVLAADETWFVDGVQLEKSGFATPYITTNGASASRTAARVQGDARLLDSQRGWFAARVRMARDSVATANTQALAAWQDASFPNFYYQTIYHSHNNWYMDNGDNTAHIAFAYNAGDYITIVGYWTATTLGLSINGAPFTTSPTVGPPSIASTGNLFDIGTSGGTQQWFEDDIFWFAAGRGTLVDADAAMFNAFGNTDPTDIRTLPGQATLLWTADTAANTQSPGFSTPAVGPIAARGGWSGLQAVADGAPISALLESSITTPIDISAMDNLIATMPDYNAPDGASSYVELTSSPDGTFGTPAYNSGQVLFSANASVMPELRFPVSAFSTGAGVSFSLAKVTGVRVNIADTTPPAIGTTFTMMGMRAVKTAWTESALDFDTRVGGICVPVTITGSPYAGTVAKNFQFVRGDGSKEDPIPMNLAMNMYFSPGGKTTPNDATGAVYNVIGFILREAKSTADGTGSHLQARLKFNDAGTFFETVLVSTTGGSPGTETDTALNSVSVGGPLDGTKHYLLRVNVIGTQIDARIYETDIAHNILSTVWQLPTTITNSAYVQRNGRVGFVASLISRDAFIDEIDVAPTGFAELKTKRYTSRSPIDGAQLAAIFAPDINLWSSYTAADLFIDQTKTVSGNGSYRTALGLTSNSFVVDDWTESYLQLALWVPSGVTLANQPRVLLNTATGQNALPMPKLQPSQWNYLYFDLGIFRNLISANGYSFTIAPALNPDTPLGTFWVDGTTLGRRRVAWSVRATTDGLFREFKNNVNNPDGAVHFPANERGTQLQVKAVALTEDAWVSSFTLFPRYAELGLPVYDQGFETR